MHTDEPEPLVSYKALSEFLREPAVPPPSFARAIGPATLISLAGAIGPGEIPPLRPSHLPASSAVSSMPSSAGARVWQARDH